MDPNDPADPLASSFTGITEQLDPKSSITVLEGAITQVEPTGEGQELDGATAWHYEVAVDTTRLDQSAFAASGGSTAELPAELTYDYWIDDADQIRLATVSAMGSDVEITFTGWGEDKGIVAPTADQLTDGSALG